MSNKNDKPTSIYVCCEPDTLEPRYVGKTVSSVAKRIYTHVTKIETSHASCWFRKVKKPYYFVAEIVPPDGDWVEAEQFWIAYLKSLGARLTNSTAGGEGLYFVSEEVKNKMSIAARKPERMTKLVERNKTIEWTDELRRKAGAAKRNKPLSVEHRMSVSAAMKGMTKSEETRKRMSEARKGITLSKESIEKRTATRRANKLAKQMLIENMFSEATDIAWCENE